MGALQHPKCEWVGLAQDAETVVVCGRSARAAVAGPHGARQFACQDHLSLLKARYSTGALELIPGPVPFRHFPEALP
jgi:hypothetical protein